MKICRAIPLAATEQGDGAAWHVLNPGAGIGVSHAPLGARAGVSDEQAKTHGIHMEFPAGITRDAIEAQPNMLRLRQRREHMRKAQHVREHINRRAGGQLLTD